MPRRKGSLWRVVARCALALLSILAIAAAGLAVLWATLPDASRLAREQPAHHGGHRAAPGRGEGAAARTRDPADLGGLDRVSPRLVEAVLLSEDANFFGHEGLDWEAIRLAAEHDLKAGRFARGASTVTQQLAKNLWLGTEKSLWRKVKEAVLAAKVERALSKRRILALYLNVVEWGDGVFGIEAGARHRFGTEAAALTPAQAVVLASMLPAPRRWTSRTRRAGSELAPAGCSTACARRGGSRRRSTSTRARELERILAGPAPADDGEEPPEEDEPRRRSRRRWWGSRGAAAGGEAQLRVGRERSGGQRLVCAARSAALREPLDVFARARPRASSRASSPSARRGARRGRCTSGCCSPSRAGACSAWRSRPGGPREEPVELFTSVSTPVPTLSAPS